MVLMLLIGLGLLGYAVWLSLHAIGMRRTRIVETLSDMGLYGFRQPTVTEEENVRPVNAAVDHLADSLGAFVGRRTGLMREEDMRRELRSAGIYKLTARKLMGYRVLATIGFPALWLWLSVAGNYSGARVILGLVIAAGAGWQGPIVLVRRRARMRIDEIDYQMPELIDVLVTTVEAGVGFSGSLQMASRRMHGPLGEELRLTLQEQDMGLSTEEALSNLLERTNTPAMRTFVRSILQGEQLGVSMGKIMRDLATEMRKHRRQKAEERAQKAPTKMLFPLVFLIFPAMFIVLLGPAVVNIAHELKGIGGG
jgi:tight adherence protein C